MMLGLKRGTVSLQPHQEVWHAIAAETVDDFCVILGSAAIDIQHVGGTAIRGIHAKPIIDIAVGMADLDDTTQYRVLLEQNGFIFRGSDVPGQLPFVRGDFERDTRTHHIHFVQWDSEGWQDYLNFRDYLNAHPDKAAAYDALKQQLAVQYAADRNSYTAGKKALIDQLLSEARAWREKTHGQ